MKIKITKFFELSLCLNNVKILKMTFSPISNTDILEDFFYIIMHDLRSPLSSLKQFFSMLDNFNDNEQLRLIPEMKKLVQTPLNILADLSDTIGQDPTSLIQKELTIKMIMEELTEEFKEQLSTEKAIITLSGESTISFFYIKPLIKSMLRNLISNSLKYRLENRSPEMNLSIEKKNGTLYLIYKDNSRGMNIRELEEQLFVPYNNVNRNGDEGMGLGLYIVKNVIERSGGDIKMKSSLGGGTTFFIDTAIPILD